MAMLFLKKDVKTSLSSVFKLHGHVMPLACLGLSFLFQAMWFSIYLIAGGKLEFAPFPALKGYEAFAFYWMLSAFGLYLAFAIFGAFVEEVAFRCYMQSKIVSKYKRIGVPITSLFFSLQHVHIFSIPWIESFLRTQFIPVFCFGILAGYLYVRSGNDFWSVFAFHGSMNAINVCLPANAPSSFLIANHVATITTLIFTLSLLQLWFRRNLQ